jgi:hypothetical protein
VKALKNRKQERRLETIGCCVKLWASEKMQLKTLKARTLSPELIEHLWNNGRVKLQTPEKQYALAGTSRGKYAHIVQALGLPKPLVHFAAFPESKHYNKIVAAQAGLVHDGPIDYYSGAAWATAFREDAASKEL